MAVMPFIPLPHTGIFDIKPEDRWWCAADPGWITGHSYIVYGPLLNGATIMMYEGAPNHPYPNRWWAMIEKYGINILYTSPYCDTRTDAFWFVLGRPARPEFTQAVRFGG